MLPASRASMRDTKKNERHPTMLTTRKQINDAKDKGDIRGWFCAKVPRGRPKKEVNEEIDEKPQCDTRTILVDKLPEEGGDEYNKWWSTDEMFCSLKAAAIKALQPYALSTTQTTTDAQQEVPSRSTVCRYKQKFKSAAKSNGVSLQCVTLEMVFHGGKNKSGSSPLLSVSDRKFLEDIAISRDLRNNGMSRAEMITTIMEVSQCTSRVQAKNHFDYLVRAGHFSGLKRGGRVVTCQKTTIKRTEISMEQQLRWHTSVEYALSEQARLNLPPEEFELVKEHFFCNMDESSLLGSDGTVKVIGAACKSKTEKIMSDCRASITVLRTGAAGGSSGPWIFLAAGKEMSCPSLRNIHKRKGVPPNSRIFMTPSAYMTDSVYAEIAPILADGI